MAKLTLADLKKLREEKVAAFAQRQMENKDTQLIVGMGTCGIAAGAKETFNVFVEELDKAGLQNVAVRQTGCMGLCHSEPTVEVVVPGMPTVVYGNGLLRLLREGPGRQGPARRDVLRHGEARGREGDRGRARRQGPPGRSACCTTRARASWRRARRLEDMTSTRSSSASCCATAA
jgi:NADP-reducing hydrogenase subunit HndB